MQHGAELDQAIASIMGLQLPNPNSFAMSAPIPRFSTDIEAAKSVAVKFDITYQPYKNGWVAGSEGHMAGVSDAIPEWLEMHPMLKCSKSAAHAICLAALAESKGKR